jgi:hypothetical protein
MSIMPNVEPGNVQAFGTTDEKLPLPVLNAIFRFGQTHLAHPMVLEGGPMSRSSAARTGSARKCRYTSD